MKLAKDVLKSIIFSSSFYIVVIFIEIALFTYLFKKFIC